MQAQHQETRRETGQPLPDETAAEAQGLGVDAESAAQGNQPQQQHALTAAADEGTEGADIIRPRQQKEGIGQQGRQQRRREQVGQRRQQGQYKLPCDGHGVFTGYERRDNGMAVCLTACDSMTFGA